MKWIAALSLLILINGYGQTLTHLLSHELRPFTYREQGKLTGLAVNLIYEMQRELGEKQAIKIYPFKRGLAMVRVNPNSAFFIVQLTGQRQPHFKWVGPLFSNNVVFYQPVGSRYLLRQLSDLKKLPRIGVVLGNADDEWFSLRKFSNVIRFTNFEQALAHLAEGKIDALPAGEMVMSEMLKKSSYSRTSIVNSKVQLYRSELYLAFNRQVHDSEVARWQAALDKIKNRQDKQP